MVVYKKSQNHACDAPTLSKDPCNKQCLGYIKDADVKTDRRAKCLVCYDIETDTTTAQDHVPNVLCYTVTNLLPDGTTEECEGGTLVKESPDHCIMGSFADMLVSDKKFKNATVMAHNGGGYDNRFLYKKLLEKKHSMTKIWSNGRLYSISVRRNNLSILDSYLHMAAPLSQLPAMWGLPEATKKGDFPHLFNTHSNLDYVGPMPPLSMWQPGFKSTKGKETIAKWHAECVAADYVWDNRKELVDYCMMDVQILRDSLLRYRELFLGSLEVDPLTFSTLSSCVMATFQSRFLEANQIHKERAPHIYSKKEHAWLTYLEEQIGYKFKRDADIIACDWATYDKLLTDLGMPECPECGHCMSISKSGTLKNPDRLYYAKTCCKQKRLNHSGLWADAATAEQHETCLKIIKTHGREKVNVDAFDSATDTCYLYNGCRWHGCEDCAAGSGLDNHEVLCAKTKKNIEVLKASGFNVEVQRECEDTTPQEYLEQYFHPREALTGGHTDVNKRHLDTRGTKLKIGYYDIVSLYPTVNALDIYPCGRPETYSYVQLCQKYSKQESETCTDFIYRILHSEEFCGFIKMDIQLNPLDIPVLPKRHDGKLLFANGAQEGGAYYSEELKFAFKVKAIKCVSRVRAALGYTPVRGPMKKHVEFFLRLKTISAGVKSQAECAAFNQTCAEQGLRISITPDETSRNPGLKALAKLCLNSLWGKFGQRMDLPSSLTCTTLQQLNSIVHNPQVTECKMEAHDETGVGGAHWIELKYKKHTPFDRPSESINCAWAAATTANARIRLHTMLHYLSPDQVMYMDTDSCIFYNDPDNAAHKHPRDAPANTGIKIGQGLGEWEIETKPDEAIIEYTAIGTKCYSYRTNKDKETTKMKGVPLNAINNHRLRFNTMLKLALGLKPEVKTAGFTFQKVGTCSSIATIPLERTVRATVTKRRVYGRIDTVPLNLCTMGLKRKRE